MLTVAAILYPPGTDIDALLANVARTLRQDDRKVGGVVQAHNIEGCKGRALIDLASGRTRSISQDLGPLSTSCTLDTSAMADIAGDLERQIDAGLDLLVLSRFGKTEIDGGGFRSLIGRAMLADIPVLTGVRTEFVEGWDAFHGGLGAILPPSESHVLAWARKAAA